MLRRIAIASTVAAGACWLVQSDPAPCPGVAGPDMVRVGRFCIDSTEVTADQYAAFVVAKGGDTSGQPTECSWNRTYEPNGPIGAGTSPITYIDWCDARAYCEWTGKRLCGRIGGGSVAPVDIASVVIDQWTAACEGSAETTYPYGNAYDPTACNVTDYQRANVGSDPNAWHALPVGSLAHCVGGAPGVHDLIGNVFEFEDNCTGTGGSGDPCTVRGGAFLVCSGSPCNANIVAGSALTCAYSVTVVPRGETDVNVGIRCCADLP